MNLVFGLIAVVACIIVGGMLFGVPGGLVIVLIGSIISAAIYVVPSVVAFRRNHPNRWAIFAINMAFGATVIGWIGPLVWAMNSVHRSNIEGGSHGGESGLNIFVNDVKRVVFDTERSSIKEPMTSSTNRGFNIVDELQRLAELRSRGDLTPEEFTWLKAEVIRKAQGT